MKTSFAAVLFLFLAAPGSERNAFANTPAVLVVTASTRHQAQGQNKPRTHEEIEAQEKVAVLNPLELSIKSPAPAEPTPLGGTVRSEYSAGGCWRAINEMDRRRGGHPR